MVKPTHLRVETRNFTNNSKSIHTIIKSYQLRGFIVVNVFSKLIILLEENYRLKKHIYQRNVFYTYASDFAFSEDPIGFRHCPSGTF